MPPELSIIIVNWNTRRDIERCLDSIARHRGALDVEVIVVDNASIDGSVDSIRARRDGTILIANDGNRGFAAANNQGLEIARGQHLLLLNPDTIVLDDVFSRAIAYLDAHGDVGVVGCQVLDGPSSIQQTCFRFPSPLNTLLWVTGLRALRPRSAFAGRASYGEWDRQSERDVDVVSGMFMLVRREALREVGLMDEGYFVFAEEADWCWRFSHAGWRCVFAPVGRILHVEGGSKSTNQISVRMYVEMQKNLLRFHRVNLGLARWCAAKALFTVSMTVRAAVWALIAPFGSRLTRSRARCAFAAARFHWTGQEPA